MQRVIRIGTRKSRLALVQTDIVKRKIEEAFPDIRAEVVEMSTKGDELLDRSLTSFGGKGVFTRELEEALLDGKIDLAVHSAKDMPMEFPEGKWNVKYTMEEFASCPEALEIVSKAVKLASNFDIRPGTGMWDMMKNITPEEILSMTGNMMPEGFLESLNAQLITIEKE